MRFPGLCYEIIKVKKGYVQLLTLIYTLSCCLLGVIHYII